MSGEEKIFQDNMKLVPYILSKCFSINCDYDWYDWDDLCQEGYIALWNACIHYNPNHGIEFSTYAGKCITKHISRFLAQQNIRKRKPKEPILSLDYMLTAEHEREHELIDRIEAIPQSLSLKPLQDVLTEAELATLMLYYEGIHVKDIAKKFGLSREGVYLRLRKAKKKLEDNIIYI